MRLQLRPVFHGSIRRLSGFSNPKYVNQAQSGRENFEKEFEKCHVKTSPFQKCLLSIGSSVISITAPSRGDMVAVMGEVTGSGALEYMREKMSASPEGRRILEEKPRISSGAVDLNKLKTYPEGTLGKAYSNFLERYGYSPDTRNAVKFVDDMELAYVAQRYREAHDLFHTILNMPTNMLGEVTVKWVEAIQTRLPMCITGAVFGSVRLAPKFSRSYSTHSKAVVTINLDLAKELENSEHPYKTHSGQMSLKCQEIPELFERGIVNVLEDYGVKNLIAEGKILESKLLHRQLPPESDTVEMRAIEVLRNLQRRRGTDYEDMSPAQMSQLNTMVRKKLKHEFYNWQRINYDQATSLQYLMYRAPAEYAALKRVFNEIRKRDPDFSPRKLFDFGAGVGTVTWSAHEYWGDTLNEYYCVDSSSFMNEIADLIIRGGRMSAEPVVSTVYRRQFLPLTPKPYDIVVSSFSLFELSSCRDRLQTLSTLWNNTTTYLVLVELGSLAGFHLMTEARKFLLEVSRDQGVDCHVFAPCPHELDCPRLTEPGKATPCNFVTAYRHLKVANLRHQTGKQKFSFLILKKGSAPPESERSCRIVREVRVPGRQVACTLCTTKGKLASTIITAAKHGMAPYKCLRYSQWGDMLPQGMTMDFVENDRGEYLSDQSSSGDEESDTSDDESGASNEKSRSPS